jgi:hypothetical protein
MWNWLILLYGYGVLGFDIKNETKNLTILHIWKKFEKLICHTFDLVLTSLSKTSSPNLIFLVLMLLLHGGEGALSNQLLKH